MTFDCHSNEKHTKIYIFLTMALIKGNQIMVFLNSHAVAFATNHTLNLTANQVDVASKDHGTWGAKEIQNIDWEASTENLYCSYVSGQNNYDTLFDAMVNKTQLDLVFGKPTNWDENGLTRGGNNDENAPTEWNSGTSYLSGKCYITSLQLNAPNGENANYTATFTGSGPITRVGDSLV